MSDVAIPFYYIQTQVFYHSRNLEGWCERRRTIYIKGKANNSIIAKTNDSITKANALSALVLFLRRLEAGKQGQVSGGLGEI